MPLHVIIQHFICGNMSLSTQWIFLHQHVHRYLWMSCLYINLKIFKWQFYLEIIFYRLCESSWYLSINSILQKYYVNMAGNSYSKCNIARLNLRFITRWLPQWLKLWPLTTRLGFDPWSWQLNRLVVTRQDRSVTLLTSRPQKCFDLCQQEG